MTLGSSLLCLNQFGQTLEEEEVGTNQVDWMKGAIKQGAASEAWLLTSFQEGETRVRKEIIPTWWEARQGRRMRSFKT